VVAVSLLVLLNRCLRLLSIQQRRGVSTHGVGSMLCTIICAGCCISFLQRNMYRTAVDPASAPTYCVPSEPVDIDSVSGSLHSNIRRDLDGVAGWNILLAHTNVMSVVTLGTCDTCSCLHCCCASLSCMLVRMKGIAAACSAAKVNTLCKGRIYATHSCSQVVICAVLCDKE
jgi:hypothetical protein